MPILRIPFEIEVEVPSDVYAPVIWALTKSLGTLSQPAAARLAGMSCSAFSRDFSRVFGVNFRSARSQLRLHIAAVLLCDTSMRVSEITRVMQYESLQEFERAFKRRYGAPPTRYRQINVASDLLVFCTSSPNAPGAYSAILPRRLAETKNQTR